MNGPHSVVLFLSDFGRNATPQRNEHKSLDPLSFEFSYFCSQTNLMGGPKLLQGLNF